MAGQPTAQVQSGDALFAFDSEMTIIAWNHAAEELTGVSSR
jgi:PAS domain-containing protein